MPKERRKRYTPEGLVCKLRDADEMQGTGRDQAAFLRVIEVNEAMPVRSPFRITCLRTNLRLLHVYYAACPTFQNS